MPAVNPGEPQAGDIKAWLERGQTAFRALADAERADVEWRSDTARRARTDTGMKSSDLLRPALFAAGAIALAATLSRLDRPRPTLGGQCMQRDRMP
jgi:hypothetical protein